MEITANYPAPLNPVSYTLLLTPAELHDLQVVASIQQADLQAALYASHLEADATPTLHGATMGHTTTNVYGLMKRISAWRPKNEEI